ncbi:MAG TPA: glycosyltransferase family 39 protein [Patescibacteria group bacterium]|nr:glycosyltransferase family 39 protein [Patescibacteria group bacterium]
MKIKQILLFLIILSFGGFLRFYGLFWDSGFHLQPDERFLTFVSIAMTPPHTLWQYFNPMTSSLNPFLLNFSFYVYGIFPLTLNKILAILFHTNTYSLLTFQGRVLSGFFDLLTLCFVFLFARLLNEKYIHKALFPFYAMFFYAIAVLPIQLSHFFTVDMFANFFAFSSCYFSLRFVLKNESKSLLLSALLIGLAIASKINSGLILPLNIFFISSFFLSGHVKDPKKRILKTLLLVSVYFLISYIFLRVADPYMFANSNPFNPMPHPLFRESLQILYNEYSPTTNFPPAFQWLSKTPILFSLKNIMFFGLGIPFFLCFLFGSFIIYKKYRKTYFSPLLFWCIFVFVLQAIQFAQTMRYFIFLYPFFALIAGLFATILFRRVLFLLKIIFFCTLLTWPLAFFSIYIHPNTRIAASIWINQHINPHAVILNEYWDDSLPLFQSDQNKYAILQLPVFDVDTDVKWQKMNDLVQQSDYLVLSSPRAWATIESLPQKYPKMSKWYRDLFSGKLPFKKAAEFHSYPSLSYLGIPITFPDTSAEEAFTVFDHPQVFIFQHIR